MRWFHASKAPPRFLILAPLFGASVALIVMAQYPGSAVAQIQEFPEHYCGTLACKDIGIVQGTAECPPGVGCKLKQTSTIVTCRPYSAGFCINNKPEYGSTNCSGKCEDDGTTVCYFEVYHCSNGP
jgi:hypothetical protein